MFFSNVFQMTFNPKPKNNKVKWRSYQKKTQLMSCSTKNYINYIRWCMPRLTAVSIYIYKYLYIFIYLLLGKQSGNIISYISFYSATISRFLLFHFGSIIFEWKHFSLLGVTNLYRPITGTPFALVGYIPALV